MVLTGPRSWVHLLWESVGVVVLQAPARSIIDAAATGTAPEQIEMAVRQALEQGLVTRRSLLARARRRGGRVAELVQLAVREAGS